VLVVLSGCGHLDGSEIREAVLTLLALDRRGAVATCAAPDSAQAHVVNHLTGQVEPGAQRNVLHEAARIARGAVEPLERVRAADFDAIFLPGGYGAAKNLSSFAFDGAAGTVHPELTRLLREFRAAGKPVGAVCIAPAVLVLALGEGEVTIGDDAGTAAVVEAMGGVHHSCPVDRIHVDTARRIVTAPAYMYGRASISGVADGIDAAVGATLDLVSSR